MSPYLNTKIGLTHLPVSTQKDRINLGHVWAKGLNGLQFELQICPRGKLDRNARFFDQYNYSKTLREILSLTARQAICTCQKGAGCVLVQTPPWRSSEGFVSHKGVVMWELWVAPVIFSSGGQKHKVSPQGHRRRFN